MRKFVTTVAPDEFVRLDQAANELGLRKSWLGYLVRNGDMVWCTPTSSGPLWAVDVGVTRESLAREVEWWRDATAEERRRRKLRLLFRVGF